MLHPKILEGLKEIGITKLTLPQLKAIPFILNKKNCLIIAPTGMGKTEAALLPIFHLFMKEKPDSGISILYITPLRALNRDMLQRTFYWGKKLNINIAIRHGDTSPYERRRQAVKPPDMLITTPETLQILLVGKRLRKSLKNIRWVVVDEIHELAEDERGAQLSVALERLNEIAGEFQRIGLSATVGSPEEIAKFLAGKREVKIINAMEEKRMEIDVEYPEAMEGDEEIAKKIGIDIKYAALLRRAKELIEENKSTLFFVNTRDTAEILSAYLREIGVNIEVHHGSLSKLARIEAEEKFKRGEIKALICTSSLELGIDIGRADFILQFNSPRQVTRLIQRIGRSGHKVGEVARGKILAVTPEEYAESVVITEKAMNNDIEKIIVRKNPLDVLANQIISMAVEYENIEVNRVYEIITRAYPFWDLSKNKFFDVVKLLAKIGLIWLEGKTAQLRIKRKRKSTFYFIDNISMIPDEKSYDVIDTSTNKKIGKLDESFVSCLDVGYRFIMKGRAWEVIKKENEIYVVPSGKTHTVPDWVGEEIPVPFEIARGVGRLRGEICKKLKTGKKTTTSEKPVALEIREQIDGDFVVPDDKVMTIERDRNNIYIITHFGTKTNETMAKIIGSLLAQRIGESVAIDSDAYRIRLRVPYSIDERVIGDIIFSLHPDGIEKILHIILRKSSYIRWEIVKVARKFGIIEKDADYSRISLERIMEIFDKSPLMEEVIEKTIWYRMDIEHTKQVIEEIKSGKIRIVYQSVSPISLEGEKARDEFLKPVSEDSSMLLSFKKRIEETRIKMKCLNCKYKMETRVYRAPEKCPRCGSKMIAVIKGDMEKKERIIKSASLVASYGKKAIMVLAGHGIGPDTASRILAKQVEGNELFKEIMKAEITYARTRQFWDV